MESSIDFYLSEIEQRVAEKKAELESTLHKSATVRQNADTISGFVGNSLHHSTKMAKYSRTDFAQVGTTNRGCMQVVPGDKKKDQLDRIAVGGQNGCVILLSRKHNDTQILFKTPAGPEIESMCLGGAIGTIKDKIFVASDTSVRGINRKGKTFFSFDTNMAETAKRMYVHGVELVLTGKRSYNHYHDCADANYYLCSEDIFDVVSLVNEGAWGDRPFTSILACSDSTIKVIEGSLKAYDINLTDVPLTLNIFINEKSENHARVLYGTKNGKLGLVHVPSGKGEILWEIETTTKSAITVIKCFHMTNQEVSDIVIGKEDGTVELYTVDENENPVLFNTFNCDESITGLGCGNVTSWNEPEIIVCTFRGWLFSLSRSGRVASEPIPQGANFSVKVQQLKAEVEELETKVNEERQRYEELTKKSGGTNVAFIPNFQIHDKFEFSPDLGLYNLTIELVIPIDFVLIQSHLPIRLVEVEKNASVVCQIRKNELNPWPLLASYRCQANVCRLELRVRVIEGNCGLLNLFVSPKIHPKVSQVASYTIKALSAHVRVHNFDLSRPISVLSFTGSFSISEAHAWLYNLVPDVPLKCPPAETITNNFQCAINGGTQLQVTYSKGSAVFRSDSVSTISIIRDQISDEILNKQMRVDVSCDLNEASVEHCLRLLHPTITKYVTIETQKKYAAALKEIEVNNSDVYSFLSPENAEILRNHDSIFKEAESLCLESSGILQIYENLLQAQAKLSGRSVRSKSEALMTLLTENYNLDAVIAFFKSAVQD
ncbi:unnamed protein product [Caenorhabditis bovis]|uniref:Bardet-Biedl syndrome 7 protein homolog n=1 Tax=Caenorhabditis bovis TaxID=2654633 RepID=A0A8S1ESM8_9PELO|nr:unnamed protein product [Caenorhabditis bovis]